MTETILVVDDSRFIQVMLKDLLGEYGYRVMLASNGEQALQMARQNPPQLILLDVAMPGLSGFETCQRLTGEEATRDVPIIFLTAHTMDDHKLRGLSLGAVDYLAKPFQLTELLAKVSSQLRHAHERTVRKSRLESLEQELQRARRIQRSMLPEVMPYLPQLDVHGTMLPASDVGGDFFDLLQHDDELLVCIADVAGKGVPAALVMVLARSALRQQATPGRPLPELLAAIDRTVFEGTDPSTFVSMALLRWDAGRIEIAGAGHPPLLLRRAGGECRPLPTRGRVLGLDPDGEPAPVQSLELAPGDSVVLFTDGVTEARNPRERMYGDKRLVESFERHASGSARACIEGLLADLQQFAAGAPQHDDITLVCLRQR